MTISFPLNPSLLCIIIKHTHIYIYMYKVVRLANTRLRARRELIRDRGGEISSVWPHFSNRLWCCVQILIFLPFKGFERTPNTKIESLYDIR